MFSLELYFYQVCNKVTTCMVQEYRLILLSISIGAHLTKGGGVTDLSAKGWGLIRLDSTKE
jgi:hypothetical protein